MIGRDREAAILRLYHAEKWRVGTIATQLGLHHSTVRRVATAATAAAVLVWSGLFYSAVSHYNAATHTTAAAPSGSNGKATQAVPASAPLVTHTS